MKHIIDIPVFYDAEVILKGGRKQKMIKMFEVLPFEVNVLSTDEFPIVSVYGNKKREIGCFRGKIDTDGNKKSWPHTNNIRNQSFKSFKYRDNLKFIEKTDKLNTSANLQSTLAQKESI